MNKMNRLAVMGLLFVMTLTLFPFHVRAAESQEKDAVAYKQAYNLVLQEKWDKAFSAMEALVRDFPESAWTDDARFWQCYAREKLGQAFETVFRCYQEFINAYPESEWADDARSNMVRLGRDLARHGRPEYEAKIQAMEEGQETDVRLAALYASRTSETRSH